MPVFFLVAYTGLCTVRTWKHRRLIGADPLLINLLIAFMVMTYAHGFVNHSLYHPTTTLSFFHVLLSVFFMGLVMDLKHGAQAPLAPVHEDPGLPYVDYGGEPPDDDSAQCAA